MTFRQIQAFLLVVRTGTLAAAADHMNLTQSGVSRLISELSRNVGFDLLDRVGRGVQPTARGLAFYKVAEGVFDNAQTLQRTAAEIREGKDERIRIACIPTVATTILPAVLEAFHVNHPKAFVDIHALHPPEIINAFSDKKVDFAVTLGFCQMEQVHTEKFATAQYILAVHKDHVLAKKSEILSKDLIGHTVMGFENDSILLPNDDETRLLADVAGKTVKNVWCQASWVRYALLANKTTVNVAEPFSFPIFEPHGIVFRPFKPKVTFDINFILKRESLASPIFTELMQLFKDHTRKFAQENGLPITVML